MAKKSAKSKGYRKQTAKKPYMSKKEIALLCVIVAAVAVAAFFLFRYDDGALKVRDGAVVADGENWLIANGSNVRGGTRYYKLGEIGEIDGYTRQKTAQAGDGNIPEYTFTPAQAGGGDVSINVTCGHASAGALADYAHSVLESGGIAALGKLETTQLAGHNAFWYSYATAPAASGEAADAGTPAAEAADSAAEAPAGEAADDSAEAAAGEAAGDSTEAAAKNALDAAEAAGSDAAGSRYSRSLAGYIETKYECCITVNVVSRGDTDDDCLPDDVLLELLQKAAGAMTLEAGV